MQLCIFWILGDRDDTNLKSGEVVNELNECSVEKLTLQVFNYFKAKFMLFDIFLKPIWWFNQIYGMLEFLKFNFFYNIPHWSFIHWLINKTSQEILATQTQAAGVT